MKKKQYLIINLFIFTSLQIKSSSISNPHRPNLLKQQLNKLYNSQTKFNYVLKNTISLEKKHLEGITPQKNPTFFTTSPDYKINPDKVMKILYEKISFEGTRKIFNNNKENTYEIETKQKETLSKTIIETLTTNIIEKEINKTLQKITDTQKEYLQKIIQPLMNIQIDNTKLNEFGIAHIAFQILLENTAEFNNLL
jgi:hypothetical protein